MGEAASGFWARNGAAIRFVGVFLGVFGVLYALSVEVPWTVDLLVQPLTNAVTVASAWVISLLEPGVVAAGSAITGPNFSVNILHGCNGTTPAAMIIAGVLAYPATWKARAFGLVVGSAWVQLVNLLRIVLLYELGRYGLVAAFESVHLYVAQVVVILATAAFWLFWIGRFATPREP